MATSSGSYDIPEGFAALFKIEGGEADHHQVRADTLAASLSGLQRIAYILGAAQDGIEVSERFKPSRGLLEKYALRCGLARSGSYAIPLDAGPELTLFHDGESVTLVDAIHQIWEAIATNSEEHLKRLLPSPILRKRLAREALQILPRSGSPYRVGFRSARRSDAVVLTPRAVRTVKDWLQPAVPDDAEMTVTGKLQRIDFDRKVVAILFKPTQRTIECIYLPEIEDTIVESRAAPIQVTGKFSLDEDGYPKQLTEVNRIEPIDLSPVILTESPLSDGSILRMATPLELDVSLDDESGQYMVVEDSRLGIHAFALNRELLMDELEDQIRMLWAEYAKAADNELDEESQARKRALLAAFEEAVDA